MDSPSNRHVVQIFNERENELQTTVLAIPNYRLRPTGETEFQWWETPANQPKAMRAWFYPGDNFGQEFAYPKTEAVKIAASNTENVPTTYAENQSELATAKVGAVDRAGTEMELDRETYNRAEDSSAQVAQAPTPTPAPEPMRERTPQPVAEPQPETQVAQARTTDMDNTRSRGAETLPETASAMPLIGLAGLLALGAGAAVRKLGNR
jgi:hypothetical protein